MGERGPAPLPTALKLLHGETRSSRLNRQAPKPKGRLPTMPEGMSEAARAVWKRQVSALGASGVLSAVDADALRAYCDAVARYQQAAPLLESAGPLVRGDKGAMVKNPLHQVVRDTAMLIRLLARDLGFVPSAREGLRAKSGEEDPLEAWTRGDPAG